MTSGLDTDVNRSLSSASDALDTLPRYYADADVALLRQGLDLEHITPKALSAEHVAAAEAAGYTVYRAVSRYS